MGICESKQEPPNSFKTTEEKEMIMENHITLPIYLINKAMKSVCKIIIKNNPQNILGTGFFMKISDSQKYLITNYHIISEDMVNKEIEIELYNQEKMKLNFNNRDVKYFPKPKDITMIEIKNEDSIFYKIKFLDYDLNYIKGYMIYENANVFSIQYPNGRNEEYATGKIIKINGFEFDHLIPTNEGSSGSPIILFTKDKNSIQVIGIHKETKDINKGTFIGEIFSTENNDINININNTFNNNYIFAEIKIKDEDINREIRIINSYEEEQRRVNRKELKEEYMNEEEIKFCKIRINDKPIQFNYYYKFPNKGKYIIKYSFNNYLTKTNYMFYECSSLINIDLSKFNTQDVTNMYSMFFGCSSLTNINLSNINTQKVTNMDRMFLNCSSLTNIDLSNFNTQNVTDMSCMFNGCTSLKIINLSNFNTQNVINMSGMFSDCSALTKINLSNFNTQNVTDVSDMFYGCSSLTNIDLSNFNTQKIIDMRYMFNGCSSLTNLNLSNFNSQNVTDMDYMFLGCLSLKKEKIISEDNKIFNQFLKDNN